MSPPASSDFHRFRIFVQRIGRSYKAVARIIAAEQACLFVVLWPLGVFGSSHGRAKEANHRDGGGEILFHIMYSTVCALTALGQIVQRSAMKRSLPELPKDCTSPMKAFRNLRIRQAWVSLVRQCADFVNLFSISADRRWIDDATRGKKAYLLEGREK